MMESSRALTEFLERTRRDDHTWCSIAVVDQVRVLPSGNSIMLDAVLQPDGARVSARLGTPYAGGGRGMVFKPRPGDEVLLLFPRGDLNAAIAVCGIYNGVDVLPNDADAGIVVDGREGDDGRVHIRGDVAVVIEGNRVEVVTGTDERLIGGDRNISVQGAVTIESAVGVTIAAPSVELIASQTNMQLTETPAALEQLIKSTAWAAIKTHTHPDTGPSSELAAVPDVSALTQASRSE